jgi:hypothetical protein
VRKNCANRPSHDTVGTFETAGQLHAGHHAAIGLELTGTKTHGTGVVEVSDRPAGG